MVEFVIDLTRRAWYYDVATQFLTIVENVFLPFGKNALSNLAFSTIVRNCVAAIGGAFFGGAASAAPLFIWEEMREIKMKKVFSLLLALIMVLSLDACGGPSKEELQREADRRQIEEHKKRLEEIKEENEKMDRDFQKFYDAYDNYKKYN